MAHRPADSSTRACLLALLLCAAGCAETPGTATGDGAAPDAARDATGDPLPPAPSPPTTLGPGFLDITPDDLRPGVFPRPANHEGRRLLAGGVFVDVDEDGRSEVVLAHRDRTMGGPGVPLVRRLMGATLTPLAGFDIPAEIFDTLVTDLDGDGHVDVLGLRPAPQPPGLSLAEASGQVAVMYGMGGGRFEDVPAMRSAPGVTPSFQLESVALADLDADGWLDLVFADNGCCTECRAIHPVLRTGPRSYEDRGDLLRGELRGGAYTGLAAPLFGDAMVLGAVGRLCADSQQAFFRATAPGDDGYPRFEGFDPTPRDAVFRAETSNQTCATIGCRAPMAAAWADLDGDQLLDVFIPFDPTHSLFRGTMAPPWRDVTATFGFREMMGPRRPMLAWGSALVDVDGDGRDDLLATHGDDDGTAYDPRLAIGPQRTTLLWNATSLRFADITALTHLDRPGQWRSLALGDLDDDGDADVIVGGFGEPPRVYRNDVAAGGHTLSLRLRGTLSNARGAGARVETFLPGSDAAVVRVMGSYASPLIGVEPVVFIGTGALDRAPRVRVTWPSGVVQELTDLAAGRSHTITEPVGFAVEPASRHVRADGMSAATLRLTPARAESVVTAQLRGPGELSVARDGAAWVVRVAAPRSPGSATVTLTLDGAELQVRPRVWWDG